MKTALEFVSTLKMYNIKCAQEAQYSLEIWAQASAEQH